MIKVRKEREEKHKIISEMKTKLQRPENKKKKDQRINCVVNLIKALKEIRKTTKRMKTEIKKKKGLERK